MRLFTGILDRLTDIIYNAFPKYVEVVERADIDIPTWDYIRRGLRLSLLIMTITGLLSLPTLLVFIYTGPLAILFSRFIIFLPLSLLLFSISFLIFWLYPYIKKIYLSSRIQPALVSLTAFLYALSSSGSDLDGIFSMVVESFDKVEALPFHKYLYYRRVLGWDTFRALKRAAERCPNDALADILDLLARSITLTEDLTPIIESIYYRVLDEQRIAFERRINSLTFLSEIYISTMVVLPILIITMLVIITMVGGGVFGFNPAVLTSLIVYLLIPIAAGFGILITSGE